MRRRAGMAGLTTAIVAALVALWAAGQPWSSATQGTAGGTGRDLTSGLALALPTASLAACGAHLVFGVRGRRVLAVLAALAGMGAVAAAVGMRPQGALAVAWWAYVVSAAVLVAASAVAALWPAPVRRRGEGTEVDAWAALDRGDDPTAD